MNRNLTEKSRLQLVSRYKETRKIICDLQNGALLNYISEKTLDVCGKKLGVLQNKTLVLNDMDQIGVIIDYCIYDYREEGLNAINRYMDDSQLDPDSEKYRVVKAMSESFYTLVQVEDVLPGVGARVNDVMGNKQFLLADLGLSKTAGKGLVVATRLLPAFEHYGTEDGEYIEVDIRQRADLTAAIIRICLQANVSDYIQYEDVENIRVISPIHRETRIGKNEQCPCGSGKKYKRCCGR